MLLEPHSGFNPYSIAKASSKVDFQVQFSPKIKVTFL
jgi:hypothetical protein